MFMKNQILKLTWEPSDGIESEEEMDNFTEQSF